MHDGQVREALRGELVRQFDGSFTLIVDELGLCRGDARIDMAAVNGAMHGWEIKSGADTLRRLERQAAHYERVFDYLTAVASRSHLPGLRRLLPSWWGLTEVAETDEGVVLVPRRRAKRNSNVDPAAVVQLLWRDELIMELEARGRRGWSRQPIAILTDWLLEETDADELKAAVRHRLRTRPAWPAAGVRTRCGD